MTERSRMKARLEFFAKRAFERGFMEQSVLSFWALSRIEELEAELARAQAGRRKAGEGRVQAQTPEQRKAWSEKAHARRWCHNTGSPSRKTEFSFWE